MSNIPLSTDVLIVGAGPTGLTLATSLSLAGVHYVLIDKLEHIQRGSRAIVVHAHTLEELDALGISEQLVDAGLKLGQFAIYDRDNFLLRLDFARLKSTHPYILIIPQHATETILADRLAAVGGKVHRRVTANSIETNADHFLVWLSTAEGPAAIRARYLVGADGMNSLVRRSAGIFFEGGQYQESFVLADVTMEWPHGRFEQRLSFSPEGPLVVAPLPDGQYRIIATVADAPETLTTAEIQKIVDTRGPRRSRARVESVSWSSRFRQHHRLATSFRKGRLFLMGDAAHVHSPAGGQGMNTGLVDATTLGRVLSAVINGQQPPQALDIYDQLRHPAAADVLRVARQLMKLAEPRIPTLRNLQLRGVHFLPTVKRAMLMRLSGLGRRASVAVPFV